MRITTPADDVFLEQLVRSYVESTGQPFPIEARVDQSLRALLQHAPFGLFAHTADPDPLFVLANNTAAREFGYPPEEMIGMPSRLSAAPGIDQEERARLFRALDRSGCFTGYHGRRVRRDGSVFWISDVTIWNIDGADGHRIGQAALIRSFRDPRQGTGHHRGWNEADPGDARRLVSAAAL